MAIGKIASGRGHSKHNLTTTNIPQTPLRPSPMNYALSMVVENPAIKPSDLYDLIKENFQNLPTQNTIRQQRCETLKHLAIFSRLGYLDDSYAQTILALKTGIFKNPSTVTLVAYICADDECTKSFEQILQDCADLKISKNAIYYQYQDSRKTAQICNNHGIFLPPRSPISLPSSQPASAPAKSARPDTICSTPPAYALPYHLTSALDCFYLENYLPIDDLDIHDGPAISNNLKVKSTPETIYMRRELKDKLSKESREVVDKVSSALDNANDFINHAGRFIKEHLWRWMAKDKGWKDKEIIRIKAEICQYITDIETIRA
jgi:hypothetical protein